VVRSELISPPDLTENKFQDDVGDDDDDDDGYMMMMRVMLFLFLQEIMTPYTSGD
jgi:hypothetical protein